MVAMLVAAHGSGSVCQRWHRAVANGRVCISAAEWTTSEITLFSGVFDLSANGSGCRWQCHWKYQAGAYSINGSFGRPIDGSSGAWQRTSHTRKICLAGAHSISDTLLPLCRKYRSEKTFVKGKPKCVWICEGQATEAKVVSNFRSAK